jgi:hypothetical protein
MIFVVEIGGLTGVSEMAPTLGVHYLRALSVSNLVKGWHTWTFP